MYLLIYIDCIVCIIHILNLNYVHGQVYLNTSVQKAVSTRSHFKGEYPEHSKLCIDKRTISSCYMYFCIVSIFQQTVYTTKILKVQLRQFRQLCMYMFKE